MGTGTLSQFFGGMGDTAYGVFLWVSWKAGRLKAERLGRVEAGGIIPICLIGQLTLAVLAKPVTLTEERGHSSVWGRAFSRRGRFLNLNANKWRTDSLLVLPNETGERVPCSSPGLWLAPSLFYLTS